MLKGIRDHHNIYSYAYDTTDLMYMNNICYIDSMYMTYYHQSLWLHQSSAWAKVVWNNYIYTAQVHYNNYIIYDG